MDYPINTAPLIVTQRLNVELIDTTGASTPIGVDLVYDPADPFAVTAVFKTGAQDVTWTFGRELLTEGLFEPSGDGDVHVWPCLDDAGHAVVIIELCSPDGEALVQARTGDVQRFVERVTALVPAGEEAALLDVDGAIASILAAELA